MLYYIDMMNGSNDNDGLTPYTAFSDLSVIPSDDESLAAGQIVYIRNGTVLENPAIIVGDFALYGWDSSDPTRPQAGIDAGWDDDEPIAPIFNTSVASLCVFTVSSTYEGAHVFTLKNIHVNQTATYVNLYKGYEPTLLMENLLWDANGQGIRAIVFLDKDTNEGKGLDVTIRDSVFNATADGSASASQDILFYQSGVSPRPRTQKMINVKGYGLKSIAYSKHNIGFNFDGSSLLIEDCELTIGSYGIFTNGEYEFQTGWYRLDVIRSTITALTNADLVVCRASSWYGTPVDIYLVDSELNMQRALAGTDEYQYTRLRLSAIRSKIIGNGDTTAIFVTDGVRDGRLYGFTCLDSELVNIPTITRSRSNTIDSIRGNIEIYNSTLTGVVSLFTSAAITDEYTCKIRIENQLVGSLFMGSNVSGADATLIDVVMTGVLSDRDINDSTINLLGSSAYGAVSGTVSIHAVGSRWAECSIKTASLSAEMCNVYAKADGTPLLFDRSASISADRTIIEADVLGGGTISAKNTAISSVNHILYHRKDYISFSIDPAVEIGGNPAEVLTYDGDERNMMFNLIANSVDNDTDTIFRFLVKTTEKELFSAPKVFYPTTGGELEKIVVEITDGDILDWTNPPTGYSPLEIVFQKTSLSEIPPNYAVSAVISASNIDKTAVYIER